jgi:hypothetical protein
MASQPCFRIPSSFFICISKRGTVVVADRGDAIVVFRSFAFESDAEPGVPIDDVEEVSNYVAAMQHGLRRFAGGFPLSLRLIQEIHAILLRGGQQNSGRVPTITELGRGDSGGFFRCFLSNDLCGRETAVS